MKEQRQKQTIRVMSIITRSRSCNHIINWYRWFLFLHDLTGTTRSMQCTGHNFPGWSWWELFRLSIRRIWRKNYWDWNQWNHCVWTRDYNRICVLESGQWLTGWSFERMRWKHNFQVLEEEWLDHFTNRSVEWRRQKENDKKGYRRNRLENQRNHKKSCFER